MTSPTIILIGLAIAFQILKLKKVTVRARVSLVEKVSLALSIGLILVVTFISAKTPEHYGIAFALAVLVFVSMLKIGMTPQDVNTMGRLFMAQPLKSLQSALVIKKKNGREFELQTADKTRTVVLTYENEKYDKAIGNLLTYLSEDDIQITTEEEYYRKRNRNNR